MFELRLTTPDLEVRPVRETGPDTIARLLPDDDEQDSRATRYSGYDQGMNQNIIEHQSYWSAWGR
ncbi:MAG TPA: hypothetical protein VFQ44_29530 [Streptosporangiaceae bacterium]|nr:hypothetical protein [Streptosporangiaceae bacterium]